MYTITEFSRICKMSTRMLRHYDKENILKPAYVNPENGYRYYEQGQLEIALKIKKLRSINSLYRKLKSFFSRQIKIRLLNICKRKL